MYWDREETERDRELRELAQREREARIAAEARLHGARPAPARTTADTVAPLWARGRRLVDGRRMPR